MQTNLKILAAVSAAVTFILTVLISRTVIPILKSRKMGQKILDIGPRWHKSKEGTPTMGGISFIFAMTVVVIVDIVILSLWLGRVPASLTATFVYALFCAFIGCIDDSAKLRKKQNEGLTPIQKLVLQFAAAGTYIAVLVLVGCIKDSLWIPFIGNIDGLGIIYYIMLVILAVGVMNSVNLADGIDGLASTETLTVAVFFILAGGIKYAESGEISAGLMTLGAVTAGGMLGFLVYNFHPARVFMGDTGSLFLGGIVMGGALLMDLPILVIVYGFMYILETISDIIQVVYFKLTHGKRFFKMAPIHHHFEKCGWGEIKIVVIFSLLTALLCALSYRLLPALSVVLGI